MAYIHVIDAITALLKSNLSPGLIKAYYEGDPGLIGKSSLPAIAIMKNRGKTMVGPTGTDEVNDEITIKIIFDKSDDYGLSDSVDTTERKLRLLMEDRDTVTGYFKPDTVIGILRTNYTLGQVTIEQASMDVMYYIEQRPENQFTSEAHLKIQTRERIYIPNRS
jgi:hypothetical protein